MANLFASEVVDTDVHRRATTRFREAGIRLPKIAELARPETIDSSVRKALESVDPDEAHPLNLFASIGTMARIAARPRKAPFIWSCRRN